MNGTILIVEDEARIARWVQRYLEREGYAAEIAADGPTGLQLARELNPDLIILDLMLPGPDGMAICDTLRRESDVPIIMLTAKGAQSDRLNGLDSGADDYIVKPFAPEEVVSRVRAVLRRVRGTVRQTLICDNFTLDEAARTFFVDGKPISLSQAQFALMGVFLRHPNQVLSREQLIDLAFDSEYDAFDRTIDAHIRRLRRQIHTEDRQPIETVYGAGYKFVVGEA